ncbi:secreted RxLR effector protein 161-like [Stegodyphus dumicola]|uniref:secreted RxLR effector protein 161-like n=1 Tax=Stegodyphus dumicola TaxID=202533 RepID=UPI0015AD5824|nr:secreted RxLR effector protein 161-like [Stegodyphus dumicola]
MHESHGVKTPLDQNQVLSKLQIPTSEEQKLPVPYQAAIGSLLYAAQATRPNITYAVNFLSQFSNNPARVHWNAVKRIMRYLRATTDATLSFSKDCSADVLGYSDSNYGGDAGDRGSTTGYVFLIGGGAVSWCSKRQPTIATSTTEAKYMALSAATKEAIWLNKIVKELGIITAKPVLLYYDNNSAINLSKNSAYHGRSKHIDIQHHFVREAVKLQHIDIQYKTTNDMIADFLTKNVNSAKHEMCAKMMGLN